MVVTSKVPMLKPSKFEIWMIRIKQYIPMMDYALWELIENGATLPKTQAVECVTTDVKLLLEADEKRFSGNAATKKNQKNLLKQQYENFTTSSSKMLDQTFDRLQKLRNKANLYTMSMVDLYNNLKVYEPEVKGMSSSSSSTQNMTFVSSSNHNSIRIKGTVNTTQVVNTAQAVNTANEVFTASTQVNATFSTNIENLSDAVILSLLEGSSLLMAMRQLVLISPMWSATTATRGDILLGSAELQEIKTTSTRKAQERVCLWKQLIPQLWCHVMVLVDMTRVIRQRKDLIMHSWLSHLQFLTQRNFMPPTPDLSLTGINKFANKPVVKNNKAKSSEEKPSYGQNYQQGSTVTCPCRWQEDNYTEASIIRDLQVVDEKGIDCLPNSTIFKQFVLMRKPTRKVTQVPQPSYPIEHVADEAVYKELGDSLVRVSTTAFSLEAEQDNGAKKPMGILLLKLGGEKVFVVDQEVAKYVNENVVEETSKPKVKGIVIHEQEELAKIDTNYQLAERLQAQKQEELSDAEKATLFIQLLEKRRKHFVVKRAEEKRNKPPTQAQKKKIMCTYLKNMEGYMLKQLKSLEFDKIQEMFDRAFKRVKTFEPIRSELVERKEKGAGEELIQERTKNQKVDDDKETTELNQLMEIIQDKEEVAIDAIPLDVNKMLESFNREDLEDMYKLVKARYGTTRLVKDLDLLLWGDLKTMFEPHVEDKVWKLQQGYKVLNWKLYDSYGVHSLRMQSMQVYMLVEKTYPLTPLTLLMMLEKKLQIDYQNKDQDHSAGSDRGTKIRKSRKEAGPSKDLRSKEELDTGNNDEKPNEEAALGKDWYKKPERPPTLDPDWAKRQRVDFRPSQTWISDAARAEKPPASFGELNDTSFDFSAFVLNQLNIPHLTQELMVGPATTERLDWHNPEGKPYPFDLITRLTIMKWYDYDYLGKIEVHREDQQLYSSKKNNINKLIRTDELHKFSDGTLDFVRIALHDIASGIRMKYLPKKN
nr:hypothetical protein [Tanacetum cinerariifolium]